MPSASSEMITKLHSDATQTATMLKKLVAYAAKNKASPSAGMIGQLNTAFQRILPQIEKFKRDIGRKPPIFADEKDYAGRRKDLTKIMSATQKVGKAVSKEAVGGGDDATTVEAYASARRELTGTDAKLAQALTMVATGVKGRTGPKEAGVPKYNHIHIGGNAKYNLLFQPDKMIVLGTIPFHIDKKNNDQQKDAVKDVASRSGSKITLTIKGNKITA